MVPFLMSNKIMKRSLKNIRWFSEGGIVESVLHIYIFLVGKGRSNNDVGLARGTVFQALRPGGSWLQNRRYR